VFIGPNAYQELDFRLRRNSASQSDLSSPEKMTLASRCLIEHDRMKSSQVELCVGTIPGRPDGCAGLSTWSSARNTVHPAHRVDVKPGAAKAVVPCSAWRDRPGRGEYHRTQLSRRPHARVVGHWCWASATTTVPSENSIS
jgi:hypothetical protein